ncbi:MAG: gamma-glutamyl-gamma-aminobutyrate hydrolase [Balneolaceae bacterium]|nr:MAG: gamma-glutamyl-gamma-aminobutyrate hydrolase [Balneolaceae bacterium]
MKKVLVSQRVDYYPDRDEIRDALDQQLSLFLLECKLLPIPVPNLLIFGKEKRQALIRWMDAADAAGVVLSGGNDIDSCPERDATERVLLEWAEREKLPLLGICRGMQMMGVAAGSHLISAEGHVRTTHQLKGEISGSANSYHNQILESLPSGYRVTALSEDESLEAIAHTKLPWEGWMWHPERESPFHQRDLERARILFGS